MSVAKPPLGALLVAHLKADPRKSAVLILLAVVMLVLYGRWFWPASGPETVEAADSQTVLPVSGGGAVSRAPVLATPTARIAVLEPVARDLAGDPFALDLSQYPPAPQEPVEAGKPDAAVTEVEDPIAVAASTLMLQSTVRGAKQIACINGEFLRPGQSVNGFVLERVEPTYVVLGRDGVKVELYLPGTKN